MRLYDDPARIDTSLDSRAISFENRSGLRGQGGTAARGRKGAPSRIIEPGEKIVLADIAGPGRVRHIWMTFPPAAPAQMRALWLDVYYDDMREPSISVPCLDFFGLPHGRPRPYHSALTSAHEGRGFNAYFPMPFANRVRFELANGGAQRTPLYYQIDYTIEPFDSGCGYLHVPFRRENPTTLGRDFVISSGLRGPGRFLGCVVGIRVLHDHMAWYGEGEVKFYLDGDAAWPTICGTGLEDYVGSAWGMGEHVAFYAGVPVYVGTPGQTPRFGESMPHFVGFYRWHLPDPIIFRETLRATVQQIGTIAVPRGQEDLVEQYQAAGAGWQLVHNPESPIHAQALAERRDDYCAAAFVYCVQPQPVPRLDIDAVLTDIEQLPYERPEP